MTACPLERQRPEGKREKAALFCAEPSRPLSVARFLPAVRGTEGRASKKAKDGDRRMCLLPWEERRKVSVSQLWGEVGWFLGLSLGQGAGTRTGENQKDSAAEALLSSTSAELSSHTSAVLWAPVLSRHGACSELMIPNQEGYLPIVGVPSGLGPEVSNLRASLRFPILKIDVKIL